MALALGAAAALAGCIPAPRDSYLRPGYPDPSSQISGDACSGQAGTPSVLQFTGPGKVSFNVSSWRPRDATDHTAWYVTIAVKPPPQSGFRFVTDAVRIGSTADALDEAVRPSVRASTFQAIPADGWVDIDTLGPTSRELAARALTLQPSEALIEVQAGFGTFPGAPQRLRVVLPPIATTRERHELLPQDLAVEAASSGASAVLRSPSYQDELAAREARCRTETPERACQNVRLDPYSFREGAGPFTWVPRFWSAPGGTAPTLHFELTLRAHTADPWRLADPVVRITDASGQTKDLALGQARASLHYPVPLDAGLRGANPSLSVTVPLAQSRSRTFIRLPLYDVEGQRHQLQPIELELRRLDVGLQPLNC